MSPMLSPLSSAQYMWPSCSTIELGPALKLARGSVMNHSLVRVVEFKSVVSIARIEFEPGSVSQTIPRQRGSELGLTSCVPRAKVKPLVFESSTGGISYWIQTAFESASSSRTSVSYFRSRVSSDSGPKLAARYLTIVCFSSAVMTFAPLYPPAFPADADGHVGDGHTAGSNLNILLTAVAHSSSVLLGNWW